MANQQPAMRAFTVIKREGQDDFWLPIGAAFAHQNGEGFNVILQALPIPNGDGQCKIVLRPPKADEADPPQERSDATTNPALDAGSCPDRAGSRAAGTPNGSFFVQAHVDLARMRLSESFFFEPMNTDHADEDFNRGRKFKRRSVGGLLS